MKNPTTAVTNRLNAGNSASLARDQVDQRMLKEEFSSKRQVDYVVRKTECYALAEPTYEPVQKQIKIRVGGSYKPYEKTVVVSR